MCFIFLIPPSEGFPNPGKMVFVPVRLFIFHAPVPCRPDGSCGAALAWEWGGWFFCFFLPLNGCLLFCPKNHSLHFRVCPSGKGASPSRVDLICNLISIQPPVAFPFKLHLIIQFTSVAMGKTRGCSDEHSSFRAKGHTRTHTQKRRKICSCFLLPGPATSKLAPLDD